jgi:diaminopimelate epimerase
MHGLGNDYIVIDNRDEKLREDNIPSFARQICRRNFSVGADGLLLAYNSEIADVKMCMINPDGTEAEMCGNGIRCFAKFCYENEIVKKKKLDVETLAGTRQAQLLMSNGEVKSVKVDMGKPTFERDSIPMLGKGTCINQKLKVDGQTYMMTCLSVGNPHCVLLTDDVERLPVQELGPKIENLGLFPERINVEFAQIASREEIRVRVWERGVGETLACGTGACASAVASHASGKTNRKVTVHLLGGDLEILYDGNIIMKGPAIKVFAGGLPLSQGRQRC